MYRQITREFTTIRTNVIESINELKTLSYIVTGRDDWIAHANKSTTTKTLLLKNIPDVHPTFSTNFKCNTLILNKCNKNFVFYWLNSNTFPDVKTIFILSHPCTPHVFTRWSNSKCKPNMFLEHNFSRFAPEIESTPNFNLMYESDIKLLNRQLFYAMMN